MTRQKNAPCGSLGLLRTLQTSGSDRCAMSSHPGAADPQAPPPPQSPSTFATSSGQAACQHELQLQGHTEQWIGGMCTI